MTRRGFGKRAVVVHVGFKTYLLIAVIALVFIGILYPPFFNRVTDMLGQLARAIRGS